MRPGPAASEPGADKAPQGLLECNRGTILAIRLLDGQGYILTVNWSLRWPVITGLTGVSPVNPTQPVRSSHVLKQGKARALHGIARSRSTN